MGEMDGNKNEWAIAFHGIHEETGIVLAKVIIEGLRIGPRQLYKNDKCVETK